MSTRAFAVAISFSLNGLKVTTKNKDKDFRKEVLYNKDIKWNCKGLGKQKVESEKCS